MEVQTRKVEYRIKLIGIIWMPPVLCASARNYDQEHDFATWSELPDWDDPKAELDALQTKLGTDTGDFQSIEDWWCERVETTIKINPDTRSRMETTTYKTIHEWRDPESEMKYLDCYASECDS